MKLQERRIQVQLSLSYRLSLTDVGANQRSVDLVMAYKSGYELLGEHQTYLKLGHDHRECENRSIDKDIHVSGVRRALISTFGPIVLA